ncbi:RNA polymerase sigma factor [Segetibacter sp. 3557_3]|uniref:RNA polymerase sigma factor n=1 Tax=Segetibacter sp. 3557_3 TaxID=2547429 RepID=UPI0014051033|nr:RNA polymerase sigma factor [Segetibacter sp. 3557_3]
MINHSNDIESILVLRFTQGDKKAFEEIYRHYSEALYKSLQRLTRSASIAEELLQESFIRLWSSRNQVQAGLPLKPFLFKIATNLVYDFFRKAARDRKLYVQLRDSIDVGEQAVVNSLEKKENDFLLNALLDTLPRQRRLVFKLSKLEGWTYDQISIELGISKSTISDHIVKANRFLHEYVRRNGELIIFTALCLPGSGN